MTAAAFIGSLLIVVSLIALVSMLIAYGNAKRFETEHIKSVAKDNEIANLKAEIEAYKTGYYSKEIAGEIKEILGRESI